MPGEISLAHNGVLFLDEIAEFNKKALEALRQPMEDQKVTISRVRYTNTYPANFMVVAAMNPCPCGNYGNSKCHQQKRYAHIEKINCNAQMTPALIKEYCHLEDESKKLLKLAYDRFQYSARTFHKFLKVGRTFADLEGSEKIRKQDIAAALMARDLDKEQIGMLIL